MERIAIEDYIPVGYERRISRKNLVNRTGVGDRLVRQLIELSDEPIVHADGGYFIPGNDYTDKMKARGYYLQEQSRARSIQRKLRKLKEFK